MRLDTAQRHLERDFHRFDLDAQQHDDCRLVVHARQHYAAVADHLADASSKPTPTTRVSPTRRTAAGRRLPGNRRPSRAGRARGLHPGGRAAFRDGAVKLSAILAEEWRSDLERRPRYAAHDHRGGHGGAAARRGARPDVHGAGGKLAVASPARPSDAPGTRSHFRKWWPARWWSRNSKNWPPYQINTCARHFNAAGSSWSRRPKRLTGCARTTRRWRGGCWTTYSTSCAGASKRCFSGDSDGRHHRRPRLPVRRETHLPAKASMRPAARPPRSSAGCGSARAARTRRAPCARHSRLWPRRRPGTGHALEPGCLQGQGRRAGVLPRRAVACRRWSSRC